jgi:hypothetical protein
MGDVAGSKNQVRLSAPSAKLCHRAHQRAENNILIIRVAALEMKIGDVKPAQRHVRPVDLNFAATVCGSCTEYSVITRCSTGDLAKG